MEFRQTGFLFARHPQARSLADAMRSAVRQSAQRPPEPPQDSHIDDFPPGEDAGMSTLLIDIVTEQDWVPANG